MYVAFATKIKGYGLPASLLVNIKNNEQSEELAGVVAVCAFCSWSAPARKRWPPARMRSGRVPEETAAVVAWLILALLFQPLNKIKCAFRLFDYLAIYSGVGASPAGLLRLPGLGLHIPPGVRPEEAGQVFTHTEGGVIPDTITRLFVLVKNL